MTKEVWGVGNAAKSKAFATAQFKNGEAFELIHGEHPHSRQDNSVYARRKDGSTEEFDGHFKTFKIEIEEFNYLKESEVSGDQIRKGGSVKVFCDGIQIMDEFCRSYEGGYKIAERFISEMNDHWDWFPKNVKGKIGEVIGYYEQLCRIKDFIVDQGCMLLETVDGKPFKKQLWESEEDYEAETVVKVEIYSPHITWHLEK